MIRKGKRKIIFTTLVILLLVILVGMYFITVKIYDESFNYRCETSLLDEFNILQFPTLTRERHTFTSNDGQTLVGYLYEKKDAAEEKKAVIVFAHGLGAGGQTGYMDIFHYFTEQGYYVFAYDATGNDESEGEVIGGLPQGFIDLDHAIDYAYTIEEINELPFVLMGYSWGGLSVVNVLNDHPEVEAVVSMSGWNKSMNMIEHRGCEMAGDVAKVMLPFAQTYEFFKYGKYAFSTGMKGFEKSDCDVMVIHGDSDETVPIQYGYETYYEKYAEDERFVFEKIENRGHDLNKENGKLDLELMDKIVAFYKDSLER